MFVVGLTRCGDPYCSKFLDHIFTWAHADTNQTKVGQTVDANTSLAFVLI